MPLQPALTNGSVKPHRPILKWTLIALASVWVLAIMRVEFFGTHGNTSSQAKPVSSVAPTTVPVATVPGAPVNAAAPPDQMVNATLASFIPAWLTPGTPEQRQAALAPTTEPHLLAQLINVPPEALPQAQLSGTPEINSQDPSTAIATASLTDGTFVAMRLEINPDGSGTWLVTDIDTPSGPSAATAPALPPPTPAT